ncbi:MAG: hypothetical protein FJ387_08360 [Verrucomicrobia bacterium]|nr:hypothetical protein [Verrucomicrobiota bacterium]
MVNINVYYCLAVVALGLLGAAAGHAGSSLLLSEPPGWNGWSVTASVKAGFRKAGTAVEDAVTATQSLVIAPFDRRPGETVRLPRAAASLAPTAGAAKDKAEGAVEFTYYVGAAAEVDRFELALPTTTSAVSARHSFGGPPEPADAFVECELRIETAFPVTGALRLPDLPALAHAGTSTQSLLALVEGPVAGFFHPGDAGVDYPLTLDGAPGRRTFRYQLTYSIVTPFGRDPVTSYRLVGTAAGPSPAPERAASAAEESVRREMPVVKLDRLVYAALAPISATVAFQAAGDVASHNTLVWVCPASGDIEKSTLSATANPLVQIAAPVPLESAGAPTRFDGKLHVPPGESFAAIYPYALSQRITPDVAAGLKPTEPFVSADWGMALDPAAAAVTVQLTPGIALGGAEEEAPSAGMKRTGTLAIEGLPGIVQIASAELVFAPRDAAQAAEFAARAGAVEADTDAVWQGPNATPVWRRYAMLDTPAAEAQRQARVAYLPQMLALTGRVGTLHASNPRVLGLFATALELWIEGFNCAVNPRLLTDGQLQALEGSGFASIFAGVTPAIPDLFDSMTSPFPHLDDPRQNLRDLWAEAAMQDSDGETINVAFIDSAFAPNPDFRGYPDDIPQFNMETGERGPHVAEHPESPVLVRSQVWHGNGTVAVAAGVMGNRYGVAGVGGQLVQPMLYYMGTRAFAFEMGQAMELAVRDGADVINISAGYPCRILGILGPVRICSEEERAALGAHIAALVATSTGAICGLGAGLDFFLPGAGSAACASATATGVTAVTALFDALFLNSALGDPRHAMERGVATARAAGVPVVASAGNQIDWSALGEWVGLFESGNFRADEWEQVPGVIPDVICVSATTPQPPYPNRQMFGPTVDLWAPEGQPIMLPRDQADPSHENVAPDAQVILDFFGSSASAPFVSGIIAHMMAVNPALDPHRATPEQRGEIVGTVTRLLRESATAPGSIPEVPASLEGDPEVARRGLLVNAYAARAAARNLAGVPALDAGGFNGRLARFDVRLSGSSAWAPGASPLRRADVLYRLTFHDFASVPGAESDAYDRREPNNDTPEGAVDLSPSSWVPLSGSPSVFCSTASRILRVQRLTLHGCGDVDWFRLQPWAGYDPARASWGTLRAELQPRMPGVRLQFFEEVAEGDPLHLEPTPAIGDGGGLGVEINPDAHPLPLLLKVEGSAATEFDLVVTFCIPSTSFTEAAAGGSSARSGRSGAFEFWEALRELRLIRLYGPIEFDRDFTEEIVRFNWPTDMAGRSLRGQLFLLNHTGGPLRLGAVPGGPGASIRLDFSTTDGTPVGSAATRDLQATDGEAPDLFYFPQSAPFVFETKAQPPGDYLLAVSGFRLSDAWTFTLGAAQTLPGYPNVEGIGAGQWPSPVPINQPAAPRADSGPDRLRGGAFRLEPVHALALEFPVQEGQAWRVEYSMDGKNWTENGPALLPFGTGMTSQTVFPPANGFWRLRSFWPRRVMDVPAAARLPYFALPTEPGRAYASETSEDFEFWLLGTPQPGDGRVFLFSLPKFGDRNFLRVKRY